MTTDACTVDATGPAPRPRARRSLAAVAAVAGVALLAAACGSSTPSASGTGRTTATAPGGATGAGGPDVVATVTSNAKIGAPILVDASGRTLYTFSADSGATSACTGSCATAWPPLTVASGMTPKGSPGAVGAFGTITRSDGTLQVTYDGHPLYTFAGDSAAGMANGQGVTSDGGTWKVVTIGATAPVTTEPAAPPATTKPATTKPATPTTTTPSSGGGYGY